MPTNSETIRGDQKERIATQRTVADTIQLTQLTSEPETPIAGMLVYADGTSWNPGSGEGIYFYNSAGSWVQL